MIDENNGYSPWFRIIVGVGLLLGGLYTISENKFSYKSWFFVTGPGAFFIGIALCIAGLFGIYFGIRSLLEKK